MFSQAQAKKAEAAKAAAKAKPLESPYAAIANGKADVEGGIIQVAARTAGVDRARSTSRKATGVSKGQILARLEDDEPRLAADERRGRASPRPSAQIGACCRSS